MNKIFVTYPHFFDASIYDDWKANYQVYRTPDGGAELDGIFINKIVKEYNKRVEEYRAFIK